MHVNGPARGIWVLTVSASSKLSDEPAYPPSILRGDVILESLDGVYRLAILGRTLYR